MELTIIYHLIKPDNIGTIIFKYIPISKPPELEYVFGVELYNTIEVENILLSYGYYYSTHKQQFIFYPDNITDYQNLADYTVCRNSEIMNTFPVTTPFYIGKRSHYQGRLINMALYEIAIYSEILTDTEIQKEIIKMQSL